MYVCMYLVNYLFIYSYNNLSIDYLFIYLFI